MGDLTKISGNFANNRIFSNVVFLKSLQNYRKFNNWFLEVELVALDGEEVMRLLFNRERGGYGSNLL
jgi:hypothetical protein